MGSVQSNLWINLTRERHTHTPSSLLFLYTHTHTWYTTISYFYPHNTSSLLWESKSLVCLLMIQSILAKTKSDNTQQSRPKWRVQQSNLWIILTGERERESSSSVSFLYTHIYIWVTSLRTSRRDAFSSYPSTPTAYTRKSEVKRFLRRKRCFVRWRWRCACSRLFHYHQKRLLVVRVGGLRQRVGMIDF